MTFYINSKFLIKAENCQLKVFSLGIIRRDIMAKTCLVMGCEASLN